MKKSLLAFAASTLFALTSASVFSAAHTGAMPAPGSAAPMAAPMTASTALAGSKDDAKAMNQKGDDAYKAAKTACKPMKGDAEKSCKSDAKLAHDKSEAQSKGVKDMADAKSDKEKAKIVAKYEKDIAKAESKAMKK